MNRLSFEQPPKTNGAAHGEPRESDASRETRAPSLDGIATSVTAEWLTQTPPRREWLLCDSRRNGEGVLPLGKAAQIIAEGGAGKTMTIIQLAIAVATGTPWLGAFPVANPGRVLLALGEEDAEEARRRTFHGGKGIDPKQLPTDAIVVLPLAGQSCAMLERDERGNPIDTLFLEALRGTVARGKWRLIVLDPLSRFAGPDAEKDNAAGTRFVQTCESLCTLTGATVLVSHHTDKVSRPGRGGRVTGSSSRGSTSLHDGFRWQAALSVEEAPEGGAGEWFGDGVVTLSFTKSNYSRRGSDLLLRRDDGGLLVPLDAVEREALTRATSGTEARATKTAEREAERERLLVEREAKDAARRAERDAKAAQKDAERREAEDAALRACLTRDDALNEDALISAMRAELGRCSDPAAKTAIARARSAGWVEVKPGPKNAKLHSLNRGAS